MSLEARGRGPGAIRGSAAPRDRNWLGTPPRGLLPACRPFSRIRLADSVGRLAAILAAPTLRPTEGERLAAQGLAGCWRPVPRRTETRPRVGRPRHLAPEDHPGRLRNCHHAGEPHPPEQLGRLLGRASDRRPTAPLCETTLAFGQLGAHVVPPLPRHPLRVERSVLRGRSAHPACPLSVVNPARRPSQPTNHSSSTSRKPGPSNTWSI